MTRRITVGPFNRVEGDLEVRLDLDDGVVRSPKSLRLCIAASNKSCAGDRRWMR